MQDRDVNLYKQPLSGSGRSMAETIGRNSSQSLHTTRKRIVRTSDMRLPMGCAMGLESRPPSSRVTIATWAVSMRAGTLSADGIAIRRAAFAGWLTNIRHTCIIDLAFNSLISNRRSFTNYKLFVSITHSKHHAEHSSTNWALLQRIVSLKMIVLYVKNDSKLAFVL